METIKQKLPKGILENDLGEYFHICSIMEIELFKTGFDRTISIETKNNDWYIIIEEYEIIKKHVSEFSDEEKLMGVFYNGWTNIRKDKMTDHFKIKFCPFCGLKLET